MNKSSASLEVENLQLLKKQQSDWENKEKTLTLDLLKSQREIKALSPLVGEIEINLNKFEAEWPRVQVSLQRVRKNLEHELAELKKELSAETIQKLDGVIKQLSDDENKNQDGCNKLEQELHGQSTWSRICSEIEESLCKSRYTEMLLSNITKRVASAETRLKKASAVATNGDGLRAEKYILIHLANQDLNKSRVETDYHTSVSDFKFPVDKQDYEKMLVEAAQDYAAAQESLFETRATEEKEKTAFKIEKAKVLADRQNRVDNLIALAKASVTGSGQ